MKDQEAVNLLASELIRDFNRSHVHSLEELRGKLNELNRRFGELHTFMQHRGIEQAELQPPSYMVEAARTGSPGDERFFQKTVSPMPPAFPKEGEHPESRYGGAAPRIVPGRSLGGKTAGGRPHYTLPDHPPKKGTDE